MSCAIIDEITWPDAQVEGQPGEALVAGLHGGAEDFQDLAPVVFDRARRKVAFPGDLKISADPLDRGISLLSRDHIQTGAGCLSCVTWSIIGTSVDMAVSSGRGSAAARPSTGCSA